MHPSSLNKRGFTLIELLVVIAIMAVIATVGVPSLFSLTKSNQMNQATSELQGLLEQARQYAVAQNTYVWVAFNTQITNNIDTMSIAIVASMDGSDPGTFGISPTPNYTVPSTSLNLVSKVRTFQHFQLQIPGSYNFTPPTSLPATPVTGSANALTTSATFNIQIPGNADTSAFTQCMQFTPSGQARNSSGPIDIIEFALEPAQVHTVPNGKNVAIVQVNGLTGQAIVYRK